MISIIIPVYNEETVIERTLNALPFDDGIEVIVVDGQSNDSTLGIAKRYPVKIINSARGRATQMNAGASVSKGEVLLFLHADCVVDKEGLKSLSKHISLNYVGGCFTHKIDAHKLIYRCIEVSGNFRAQLSRIFYGDQAIFVRRDIFDAIGGFDAVPIFEDVIFSKKLRRLGKTIILDHEATVLPRRWERDGIFKTTLLNWFLTVGFMLNVPTGRLSKFYLDIR